MPKIGIVTVNFNNEEDTLDLLKSLKTLDTSDLEIMTIVVDNGSTDNLAKQVIEKYPTVELLQTGINLGFTGGYNRGMKYAYAAGCDYVLIINNDALIDSPNLIKSLVSVASLDEKIGLVSPKIYFAPGFEFQKDRYTKEDIGKVIWFAGGHFDWANVAAVHRGIDEVDQGQYDTQEEVEYTSGCCLLLKRSVLEKVGYFREDLFAYFEDGDFMVRVRDAGFKKYYDGKVSIYHKVSRTTGIGSPIQDYFITRNRLYFGSRYTSFRTKFALYRQAFRFLIFGRPAQKRGVWDFIQGKTGPTPDIIKVPDHSVYAKKLSIVTVNYNTPAMIGKLLDSIFEKGNGFDKESMEVVVLDNGSEKSCREVVKKYPVKFIDNPVNTGFSKGYNLAMYYTKGEYILMLNSDTEVTHDSLKNLLNEATEKKVLGGKLVIPDLGIQKSCFRLPTIWGLIKENFLGIKDAYSMYLPIGNNPVRVEGLVMAVFLIPRMVISKIGYISEQTFIYFEDIEYCNRLKINNIPLYFIPSAKFIHHHGGSVKNLGQSRTTDLSKKASKIYYGAFYNSCMSGVFFLVRIKNKIWKIFGHPADEKIYVEES